MELDQVVVASYGSEIDAELAKGHLKSSGITAIVIVDDVGGMLPSLQSNEGVKIMVSRVHEKKAHQILQEVAR
jgi:hypothetical protein